MQRFTSTGECGRRDAGVRQAGQREAREERDRALFREAFACMDASDKTIEKVMRVARDEEAARKGAGRGAAVRAAGRGRAQGRGRVTVRAALATAAATALLASGAYAVVGTDFFQTAFGPKGNPDVEARTVVDVNPVTGEPKSWVAPARTWADVDGQVADRLLGPFVADIYQSVELDGYTLTVEQCVMDENGNGVATFSLQNPGGVEVVMSEYGEASLSRDTPVTISLQGAGEGAGMWDSRVVGDAASSTGTVFRGAFYFGPFAGTAGEGLAWSLEERYVEYGVERRTSETIVFKPEATVPVRELVAQDGTTVELSPLALTVRGTAEGNRDSRWFRTLGASVQYGDGTEYVVYASGEDGLIADNSIVGYKFGDGDTARLFNRLVDVDAVESVTLEGRFCEQGEQGVVEDQDVTQLVYTAG